MSERRETGGLELEVLGALWDGDGPKTPAEVLEALETDLAYTTVLTILQRLFKKGVVTREARGRAFAYRPTLSEAELTAQRMRAQLRRSSNEQAALSAFATGLDGPQLTALRQLLETLR